MTKKEKARLLAAEMRDQLTGDNNITDETTEPTLSERIDKALVEVRRLMEVVKA